VTTIIPNTLAATHRYSPLGFPLSSRAGLALDLPREILVPPPVRRLFALRDVAGRLQRHQPGIAGSAGELNLFTLLCSAQRLVIARYLAARDGRIEHQGLVLAGTLRPLADWPPVASRFVEHFPPPWEDSAAPADLPALVATELLVLATQADNHAAKPFRPLFDPAPLDAACPWRQLLSELDRHLARERRPGRLGGSLLALLREPQQAAPDSLVGQLRYVRQAWNELLPAELLADLETAFAILEEEQTRRGGGPGPIPVPRFGAAGGSFEAEAFSRDADWMSSTVLVAKSVYVWLDQLSRHYRRKVTRLDQIPGEELDRLARWGFSALWLIGLWRRSNASRLIKQRMGNPEAVASAYSLEDYIVADDLGGDAALATLEAECGRRGIRLACDVVPNHTGIDSRWVREHPDWFIQVDHPPYPAYRFAGPDLSSDPAIELRIEDGYWDHSDAAVVFQHRERQSGQVRYLYHGNDGTHMPWNDTAQLNFLLPQVREAMIRTIIAVARRFRIIRFDAAMTLAKRHFQRLWFPLPGGGAGVPSRAEHAMSREAFEAAFPVEFWREVVDRVAAEVPDTLLLAEAFWLMEGYFVRTLGMHRVYNSAFMNMLKHEDNAKYRSVLKNVLEYNPEILKRFVNFMNNPDEATAVEQFGKGDKYFGVAVLLATLPGLPMFGHGQIEGLREKYGMEYRRAYWDETPDAGFIAHHEAQICPLLRRRQLFSGAADFELFDFESGGSVNEDVFAYANTGGGEHTLVVYHNRAAETGGWLRRAVAKAVPGANGQLHPRQTTLAAALCLDPGQAALWRWREHRSGNEYLLAAGELASEGLYLKLGAYDYRVFTDLRPQPDGDGLWAELARHLGGRGVPDLDHELRRLRYREVTARLQLLFAPASPWLTPVHSGRAEPAATGESRKAELLQHLTLFFQALATAAGAPGSAASGAEAVLADLDAIEATLRPVSSPPPLRARLAELAALLRPGSTPGLLHPLLVALLVFDRGGELQPGEGAVARAAAWSAEYLLDEAFPAGSPPAAAELLALLLRHREAWTASSDAIGILFADPDVGPYLLVHQAAGQTWFNRERALALVDGLTLAGLLAIVREKTPPVLAPASRLAALAEQRLELIRRAETAGYRLDLFLKVGGREGKRR
jgi:glycosidase